MARGDCRLPACSLLAVVVVVAPGWPPGKAVEAVLGRVGESRWLDEDVVRNPDGQNPHYSRPVYEYADGGVGDGWRSEPVETMYV